MNFSIESLKLVFAHNGGATFSLFHSLIHSFSVLIFTVFKTGGKSHTLEFLESALSLWMAQMQCG